jgi:CcmD family protein
MKNLMYDYLDTHQLYIVLIIVLIIWLGIFLYLTKLNKKVQKLINEK